MTTPGKKDASPETTGMAQKENSMPIVLRGDTTIAGLIEFFERLDQRGLHSTALSGDRGDADDVDSSQIGWAKVDVHRRGCGDPCGPFTVADPGATVKAEAAGQLGRYLLDLAFTSLDGEVPADAENGDATHNDSSIGAESAATDRTSTIEESRLAGARLRSGERADKEVEQ